MTIRDQSTEVANELIIENAKEDEPAAETPRWHKAVALSTLLFALLASIGGLLSGITAQEALLERTQEIMQITLLEGDMVEVEVLKSKHAVLENIGQKPDESEINFIKAFEDEIDELKQETRADEISIREISNLHMIFAVSVTILALGITVSGMSIIVEQKWLWYAGLAFGAIGGIAVLWGVVQMFTT